MFFLQFCFDHSFSCWSFLSREQYTLSIIFWHRWRGFLSCRFEIETGLFGHRCSDKYPLYFYDSVFSGKTEIAFLGKKKRPSEGRRVVLLFRTGAPLVFGALPASAEGLAFPEYRDTAGLSRATTSSHPHSC